MKKSSNIIIQDVFKALNLHNIKYCLWKSTDQIEKSIRMQTDFDILYSKDCEKKFESILKKKGFFKTVKPTNKKYLVNENDFFYPNLNENELVHFHVYNDLIIGNSEKKFLLVKNLDLFNFTKCSKFKIKTIHPFYEMFLLLNRYYYKFKYKILEKEVTEFNNQYFFLKKKINNLAHEEVNFFNTNYNFVKDIKNFDFSRKIKHYQIFR